MWSQNLLKLEDMRKASYLSLVGWHVRIKMADEELPWDVQINKKIRMDEGVVRYEAEFEDGFRIYIIPDDISWFTLRKPVDKIMQGPQVINRQDKKKSALRLVK